MGFGESNVGSIIGSFMECYGIAVIRSLPDVISCIGLTKIWYR